MSLTRWFKTNDSLKKSDASKSDEAALKAAEDAVGMVEKQRLRLEKCGCRKKFSEHHHLDQVTKEEIGKFAAFHGKKSISK